MRLFVATISAFALSTAATAADAQTAPHAHPRAQPSVASAALADERCLLEMVVLTNSGNDQNAKGFGQAGVIYFTGRLAHDPNFDFGRLKALLGTLDIKEVQSDLQQRCAPAFEKSMHQMQTAIAPPQAAAQPPAATTSAAPASAPTAPPAAPPAAPPVMELPH